jgi:hypothetical protein
MPMRVVKPVSLLIVAIAIGGIGSRADALLSIREHIESLESLMF